MAADLRISFHIHDDADGVERITLLTRNISGHDCLLTASYPPNFVPAQQPNGPRIEHCRHCANRLPGEELENLPLMLPDGSVAHQSFRYSVCPGPLEVGKVIPLDHSLREFGLLPTRPGTYQLSVTWSPYHSRFSACPNGMPLCPDCGPGFWVYAAFIRASIDEVQNQSAYEVVLSRMRVKYKRGQPS